MELLPYVFTIIISIFFLLMVILVLLNISKMINQKDRCKNIDKSTQSQMRSEPLTATPQNSVTEKWKETLPKRSTRIKNRNKRKRK